MKQQPIKVVGALSRITLANTNEDTKPTQKKQPKPTSKAKRKAL